MPHNSQRDSILRTAIVDIAFTRYRDEDIIKIIGRIHDKALAAGRLQGMQEALAVIPNGGKHIACACDCYSNANYTAITNIKALIK